MKQILNYVNNLVIAGLLTACGAATPTANNLETAMPVYTEIATSSPIPFSASFTSAPDTITPTPTVRNESFLLKNLGLGVRGTPQYSSDGEWLILPASVGVFVLNTASYQTGRLLVSFPDYSSDRVTISPDGKLVAWGNNVISVNNVYNLPDLQIPSNISTVGNFSALSETRFSADNRLLAVFYADTQMDIWNLLDGKFLYTLPAVSMMDFSPDGHFIATVSIVDNNWLIQLYEAQTGKLVKDWPGERAVFLPDNRLALESNGGIRIYDPSTGKVPHVFNGKFPAFSPDGKLIALLYYNQVEIHQIHDAKLLHRLQGEFMNVDKFSMRFAPDGQSLAGYAYWSYCCAGYAGRLSLWHVADGALVRGIPFVGGFNFSPDGEALAVADNNGLQIWNTTVGSVPAELKRIIIP
jgi:WD40 repeat protein